MSDPKNKRDDQSLREAAVRELEEGGRAAASAPESPEALQHELSVHQIELELQNEELRHTVLELRQLHEKYVGLYDFAPVGYFTLDGSGTIRQANLRAGQLLGVERSRLLGRRLLQFTAPESNTTLAALLPRLLASEDGLVAELRLQRADGGVFPVRLEGQAYSPGESLIAVTDITTEKAAQDELLRLNETLERRVVERTARIRELSDELRTVMLAVAEDLMDSLHRVASFVEVLRHDVSSAPVTPTQRFAPVFRSVERMEELARALLEYSRASSTRVRLVSLDLNRVFSEVEKDLQPSMEGRIVKLTHDPLPTVTADIGMMQQMFLNLLENALKFTVEREVARIHVGADETETEFILRFEDNGVGFNNRHRDKLFQVFKRLHPESAFPGVGIGLAIVRRACTRFGGRVWAEGRVGEGATFFMAWPKHPTVLE